MARRSQDETVATVEVGSVPVAERMALLGGVPAFASLPPHALQELASSLQEERFGTESLVIVEGEIGERLFLIAEGHAEAWTGDPATSVLLASYGPGEMFGEMALLTASRRRQATVTAVTPLVVLSLAAGVFDDVLERYPQTEELFYQLGETMVIARFLKQASPFATIDRQQMVRLASRLKPLAVRPGVEIVRQGEPGDTCYLLRDGQAEVLVRTDDGTDREIAIITPGMIFGEAALLTDAPRNATVRALEPSLLLVLERSDLLTTVQADRQISRQMVELVQLRDRPRQAPDIIVHQRPTPDGTSITTLKDPHRATYYRLSPEGYFVWQRLDGHHNLRDLTLEYMVAFNAFSPQAIAGVVTNLAAAGFLETRALRHEVATTPDRSSSWQRAAFFARRIIDWQVSIPSPDAALTRLYRSGIWALYTLPAQIVLAFLALAGIGVFIANLGRAAHATSQGGWVLLFLILTYFLMVVLHESGHAFTVKAFGHEVPRAGVGWYWFGPIAYADTSDMWLAGRWPRIAVTLGGLYASALVASISAMVASLLGPSVLAAVLWQLAFLSYYAVLVNLNPLMELDGYFLLMDWLDHPNLREHCLAWLGTDLVKALRDRAELGRHRLELFYGIGAVLYVFFSGFMMLVVYRAVVQGWLAQIMAFPAAAALAWLLTGTLVLLSLLAIAGDLRRTAHPAPDALSRKTRQGERDDAHDSYFRQRRNEPAKEERAWTPAFRNDWERLSPQPLLCCQVRVRRSGWWVTPTG